MSVSVASFDAAAPGRRAGAREPGTHANAGELRIDVGRPNDYERVDGSVWAGELHAEPFGIDTEGLFRSVDWNGDGEFRLRARLKAGELHLYSNGASNK